MDNNPEYNEKIISAIEEIETNPEEVVLQNGVILSLKKVPVLRIQSIVERFEYPEVPKTLNEDKGRMEENPNDPKYVEACQKIDAERILAVVDAIAAFGTEIKYVPDNVSALESEEWVEELELVDIIVPKSKIGRYLFWIKFVAIVDTDDLQLIAEQFGMQMGNAERQVQEHLSSSFPDQPVQ